MGYVAGVKWICVGWTKWTQRTVWSCGIQLDRSPSVSSLSHGKPWGYE